jgi:hypothetical protein
VYGARPFVISGTCKREDVLSQKLLIERACQALKEKASEIGGRLYSITSDGDSRHQKATAMLTLNSELTLESSLRANLGDLELFNYKCGKDEESADVEYKHVLKHHCNTLIQQKCMTLDGIVLTLQLLKSHLLQQGLKDERGVNALLLPKDKQDVKLMYDLLSSIATLPPTPLSSSPTEQKTRNVLCLLGCIYTYLLETYTNVNLSLHQQLVHLAAIAHLVMAFYRKEKGGVMPSQLYFDLMTMIKNQAPTQPSFEVEGPRTITSSMINNE